MGFRPTQSASTQLAIVQPEAATSFDFGADAHTVVHLHDGWSWDMAGADWMFGA